MVDINLPKALTQSLPSPPPPPSSSTQSSHKSNMPMLYYGLLVVATGAIVLAIYNLIIVRWCATQFRRSHEPSTTRNNVNNMPSNIGLRLTSSFRFTKGIEDVNDEMTECSVCLSVFEEGEEVRKLPRCSHSFHASCIDMWLYSHFDCPLCRAQVVVAEHGKLTDDYEHSRDELLASSSV